MCLRVGSVVILDGIKVYVIKDVLMARVVLPLVASCVNAAKYI